MKAKINGVTIEVVSVPGCGCEACHSLRRIVELKNTKMQQGMVCENCGYGWWSFDPCCKNPKASGRYVDARWEKDAKVT